MPLELAEAFGREALVSASACNSLKRSFCPGLSCPECIAARMREYTSSANVRETSPIAIIGSILTTFCVEGKIFGNT